MKNGNNFQCPEGAGGGVGEPGFPAKNKKIFESNV